MCWLQYAQTQIIRGRPTCIKQLAVCMVILVHIYRFDPTLISSLNFVNSLKLREIGTCTTLRFMIHTHVQWCLIVQICMSFIHELYHRQVAACNFRATLVYSFTPLVRWCMPMMPLPLPVHVHAMSQLDQYNCTNTYSM